MCIANGIVHTTKTAFMDVVSKSRDGVFSETVYCFRDMEAKSENIPASGFMFIYRFILFAYVKVDFLFRFHFDVMQNDKAVKLNSVTSTPNITLTLIPNITLAHTTTSNKMSLVTVKQKELLLS